MKNKKKIIIAIVLVILLGLVAGYLVWKYNEKIIEKNQVYFENKVTSYATNDLLSNQKEVDKQIEEYSNDKEFTFENPKVMTNPYLISPLSAMVIFGTNKDVSIELIVNGISVTKFESSKKHIIPIYGLKAGFNNKVLLKDSDGKEKEITMTTESYNGQVLEPSVKNTVSKDNIYFLAAPMGLGVSAFDGEGNIVWYLTENYNQDIELLKNGHVLVSNNETSSEFGYTGFLEIDYLGKIYHNFVLDNGYHHDVNELENGDLLVAGTSNNHDATNAYVYTIDRETGKKKQDLNIYELLHRIDGNFVEEKFKDLDFVNNSIDYNESTDEMVLSLRGINAIISVQYKEKKLNWILGDASFWSSNFDEYLLNIIDNSRLPKGQHTAFITADGKIGVFNNDFDLYNETSDVSLSRYQSNYASAILYEKNDKNIKTVYEYVSQDKSFNYALGSFNYTKDNHKLINFGYTFKEEAFQKKLNLYDYVGYTFARIVELDDNDNLLFNATIDQSVYRVYKGSFYENDTKNYEIQAYSLIDNLEYNTLERVKTSSMYELLNNAETSNYEFTVTKNNIELNTIFDDLQEVTFLFVGEKNDSYRFVYKAANEEAVKKIHLNLSGRYAIYLKIDDKVYDCGRIIEF